MSLGLSGGFRGPAFTFRRVSPPLTSLEPAVLSCPAGPVCARLLSHGGPGSPGQGRQGRGGEAWGAHEVTCPGV